MSTGSCRSTVAGSGATGLATHDEGCDYLLIEQNPDAVDIARARLGDSLSA